MKVAMEGMMDAIMDHEFHCATYASKVSGLGKSTPPSDGSEYAFHGKPRDPKNEFVVEPLYRWEAELVRSNYTGWDKLRETFEQPEYFCTNCKRAKR